MTTHTIPPELDAFLRELADLSKRTGFWIDGCGDCGSPWVERAEDTVIEYLKPTAERDGYKGSSNGKVYGEDVVVRTVQRKMG